MRLFKILFFCFIFIVTIFFTSLIFYNNQLGKIRILSGLGKAGDRWSMVDNYAHESVEFVWGITGVGLRGPKNALIKNILQTKNNETIFDVEYIYDSLGRRTVEPRTTTKKSKKETPRYFAIFFGCSDLLGIGLNSWDTIPSIFEAKTRSLFKAYNYGFVGTGAHYVNRLTETVNFKSEVTETSGIYVYVMTEGHYAKTVGRLFTIIRPVMPSYKLVGEKLFYQGSLDSVEPIYSIVKEWLATNWLTTRFGSFSEDMKYTQEEENLVCSILASAKKNSKKQFPKSRFILFLHTILPEADRARLIKCAKNTNIEYVNFNIPGEDAFESDPVYAHPTRYLNELAANYLANYLKKN
jgi:hypothetical protein